MTEINKDVVLVTGCTSGIGKATALKFAKEGYRVVVTGRSQERGQAVCDEIMHEGGEAIFVVADLTDKQQAENLVQKTQEFGNLKILVNNAGGNNNQALEVEMATNFYSVVYCTEAAIRVMNAGGTIINIASICGCSTVCNDIVYYSAAKAAMLSYSKNMAKNLAPNIRVNAILPGYTKTPDWGELSEEDESRWAQEVPLKRFIQPEEIAETAWFIAHSGAATGTEFVIDAGLTL